MQAPRTNMSNYVKTWVTDEGTESSDWEHTGMVSDVILNCFIYHCWLVIRDLACQVQAPYGGRGRGAGAAVAIRGGKLCAAGAAVAPRTVVQAATAPQWQVYL